MQNPNKGRRLGMSSEDIAAKQTDIFKTRQYPVMAAMCLGLEEIAAMQVKEIFPDCEISEILSGKIFFNTVTALANLLKIRCIDNLYYFIAKLPTGTNKDSVSQLAKDIQSIKFSDFLPFFCDTSHKIRIHVTASRNGKHSFSRLYASDKVLEALSSLAFFNKGGAENHDLHFRLDIIEDAAYFSLKLTSAAYRYRGDYKQFMPGAIRPSVANALIWLSHPNKKDVVLDPFCGSGTIVLERSFYPHHKILAFDISQEAVDVTKSNAPEHVIVRLGDACNLPLADHCVDTVITNAPWGGQIHSGDIRGLYGAFVREAFRVLKSDGQCIILTDRTEILEQACLELGLSAIWMAQISLHGRRPVIYQIKNQ